jgi:hypothetical protein
MSLRLKKKGILNVVIALFSYRIQILGVYIENVIKENEIRLQGTNQHTYEN